MRNSKGWGKSWSKNRLICWWEKFYHPHGGTWTLRASLHRNLLLSNHHRLCFAFLQLVSIFYRKTGFDRWPNAPFQGPTAEWTDKQIEKGLLDDGKRSFKRITKWSIWLQIRLQSRSICGSLFSVSTPRYVPSILTLLFFTFAHSQAWLYLIIFGTQLNRIKRSWYNFIIITHSLRSSICWLDSHLWLRKRLSRPRSSLYWCRFNSRLKYSA